MHTAPLYLLLSALSALFFFAAPAAEAQTQVLNPKVHILYEVDTHTPPFYRGKALPSGENRLTALALPDLSGTRLNPSTLHYRWRRDGEIMNEFNGAGERLVSLNTPIANDSTLLEVEVSDPRGTYRARGALVLSDRPPKALLYEDNSLLGVLYNRAIPRDFSLKGKEVSLLASPVFFSAGESARGPLYEWRLNGAAVSSEKRLVLRSEGESGLSLVSVFISNPEKITQSATFETSVNYGKE